MTGLHLRSGETKGHLRFRSTGHPGFGPKPKPCHRGTRTQSPVRLRRGQESLSEWILVFAVGVGRGALSSWRTHVDGVSKVKPKQSDH